MTDFVCGAIGTTGGEVMRQLRIADESGRAMTRRPEAAADVTENGLEAVVADFAEPDSVKRVVGQAPRSYRRFAEDHRAAFLPA